VDGDSVTAARTPDDRNLAGQDLDGRQPAGGLEPPQEAAPASGVDRSDLDALVRGETHNPHGILGAHPGASGTVVRTLRPAAEGVTLLADGKRHDMRRIHDGGIFEVTVPGPVGDYRLEVI
jgi:hypothetical protein